MTEKLLKVTLNLNKQQQHVITWSCLGSQIVIPCSFCVKLSLGTHSNALVNITWHVIGQRQEFAAIYSAVYRRRPYIMSDDACDWLR